MNWRERYEFRKITDINQVKVGMLAKLMVGKEKSWGLNSWVETLTGQVFEVYEIRSGYFSSKKEIGVKVPVDVWDLTDEGLDLDGFHICYGELAWFTYKEGPNEGN